jgi:hypothetical protein
MGFGAFVPLIRRNWQPAGGYLVIFENLEIARVEHLEDSLIEEAMEGRLKIIQLDNVSELAPDGQGWQEINLFESVD